MVVSGSLASGLLLTDSYRVRLTRSASGLRAHTWETLLYVIPAGPVPAKAGDGNPLRRGGRWAIAGSVVPLAFTRTWHHCETGKRRILTSPRGSSAAIAESGLHLILSFSYTPSTLIKYPYPNRTCFRRNTSPLKNLPQLHSPTTHTSDGKQIKAEALTSEEPRLARKRLKEYLLS
jgi:hypothetical protein